MPDSHAARCLRPDHEPAGPVGLPAWTAELALDVGLLNGACRLIGNRHRGPLRLQKLLHPQTLAAAEAIVLHPPGGIAGGDRLELRIDLRTGARLLVTTPGASKWYRSMGNPAAQHVSLRVESGAALEWLPQEAILFDGSESRQSLQIDLRADARMIGWDIVQLGRLAGAAPWQQGRWQQRLELRRDGRLLWRECTDLAADDALRAAAQGLAGNPVFGCLWAYAPGLERESDDLLADLRSMVAARSRSSGLQAAASVLGDGSDLLLIRAVGADAASLRDLLEACWMSLRPPLIGLPGLRPRIWNT